MEQITVVWVDLKMEKETDTNRGGSGNWILMAIPSSSKWRAFVLKTTGYEVESFGKVLS